MVDANAKHGRDKAPRRRGRKGRENQPKGGGFKENGQHQTSSENGMDILAYKPHKTLLIHFTDSTPTWYECGRGTPSRDETIFSANNGKTSGKTTKSRTNSPALVAKYRKLADSIYQQEVMLFRSNASANKDEQWVENTMKRGTLKDRIAAMSVVVSSSPVHKLYALDMLLNLAGVSTVDDGRGYSSQTNERVSSMASEALTDLFSNTLLPNHRKLLGLESRPLYKYDEAGSGAKNKAKRSISPRILLLWRYEEIIKNKYSAFLSQYLGRTLSQTSTSAESLTKIGALRTACSLLREIPEGEQMLLSLVVNKVGDPTKKIASAAGHELRKILDVHPNMTGIIAREVQQLAHRPNLSTRALYNCIIFLNQLKLVKAEPVKKSEENGDEDDDDNNNKTQKAPKKLSLPASLINTYFQIFEFAVNKTKNNVNKKEKTNEELNQAMKSRLLGALLTGVNRAHPYLPSNDTGMEQHIDSLYRIAHVAPPSASTQALMLLFHLAVGSSNIEDELESASTSNQQTNAEIENAHKRRQDRFYRALYGKIADPSMLFGRQLTLYFNLIYKAMKYDRVTSRVVAFGKRLLHIAFHYNPAVTSGAVFLLSEVMKHHPGLYSSVFTADGNVMKFDSTKREPSAAFTAATQENKSNGDDNNSGVGPGEDMATAEAGSIWELSMTMYHYHPSVCKFSTDVGSIEYNGDPLRDFSLAPFLDKFAFRNPKSLQKIKNKFRRGESVGERRSGLQAGMDAAKALPVNDPDFWKKRQNSSEQDAFFQTFFKERARRDELKGVVRGNKEEADALDKAEAKDVDFDWESDDSEERFVQSLAEGLMKSTGEKIEYDDEDPDMDDWSDYGGSDEEEAEVDAFDAMDGDLNVDADAIMDGSSDDGENDNEDATAFAQEASDDESGDDIGLTFVGDLDEGSDEDGEGDEKKNEKTKEPESSFVDASAYEDMINAAWNDQGSRKRSASMNEGDEDNEAPSPKKVKKKRRRSKKKKKA